MLFHVVDVEMLKLTSNYLRCVLNVSYGDAIDSNLDIFVQYYCLYGFT